MIPNNGYFTTKSISGGGFDENGQPIAVTPTGEKTFNCRIQTVQNNKHGVYQDGKFVNSSYVLFIPFDKTFSSDQIELFRDGKSIGKFTVQSVEHLMSVGRTKIIV